MGGLAENVTIIQGEAGQVAAKAAWVLQEVIRELQGGDRPVTLGVVGGRSVAGIFATLATLEIDWQRLHLFMLDERLVPWDHQDSNFRLVQEWFGDTAAPGSLHGFRLGNDGLQASLMAYYQELRGVGEGFDIVLTSSGEDGHIASLFPGSPLLAERVPGFLSVTDAPKPPAQRMTASPGLIAGARVGLTLFLGAAKKKPLADFLSPSSTVSECPAKLLTTIDRLFLFTDQELTLP